MEHFNYIMTEYITYEIDLPWVEEFVQHIREMYCLFLENHFVSKIPTLKEVINKTVEYCNASNQPLDDNVYLLTFPSGKRYVGQTVNFKQRMCRYKRNEGSNEHISRALKKYGLKNAVIEHFRLPTICADFVEIFMIFYYKLDNPNIGYNKTSGGKSGWRITEEVRTILRETHIGKTRTVESKSKQSMNTTGKNHWNYGGSLSYRWREKIRISNTGKKQSEEQRAKNREANSGENHYNYGNCRANDTKTKISLSLVGAKNPRAIPVSVDGNMYASAGEARRDIFSDKSTQYVSSFISRCPESDRMFYISKEFYKYCMENGIEDVTRTMYNGFEHYMNNLL